MSKGTVITFTTERGLEVPARIISDDKVQLFLRQSESLRSDFKPAIHEYWDSPYQVPYDKSRTLVEVPDYVHVGNILAKSHAIYDDFKEHFREQQHLRQGVLYVQRFFIPKTNVNVMMMLQDARPAGYKENVDGATIPMYAYEEVAMARDFLAGVYVSSTGPFPTFVRESIFEPLISIAESKRPPSDATHATGRPKRSGLNGVSLWRHFYRDFSTAEAITEDLMRKHAEKVMSDPEAFDKASRRPYIVFKYGVRPIYVAKLINEIFAYARRPDAIPEFLLYFVDNMMPARIEKDQLKISKHISHGRGQDKKPKGENEEYETDSFVTNSSSIPEEVQSEEGEKLDKISKRLREISDSEDESFGSPETSTASSVSESETEEEEEDDDRLRKRLKGKYSDQELAEFKKWQKKFGKI